MNKVILLSILPRDPALKHTPRGAPLCTFDLQVVVPSRDEHRGKTLCAVRVVAWGRQAEACWQCLTVGSAVLVEGHLWLDVRTDREG